MCTTVEMKVGHKNMLYFSLIDRFNFEKKSNSS